MDLIEALRERDLPAVQAAIRADPGAARTASFQGVSALTFASYLRFADAVAALRKVVEPDAFEAAILGEAEVCLARLPSLDARAPDGFTALHLAAHFDHPALVKALVAAGADVDGACGPPLRNRPLHAAAAGGALAATQALLQAGAAVDARDGEGNTPLMVAAAGRRATVVEALLGAGADALLRNDAGQSARDMAAERGYPELLPRLSQPS